MNKNLSFKNIVCSTGEIANNYTEYLMTQHWRCLRKIIYELKKQKCQKCHKEIQEYNVHHLTYKRIGKIKSEKFEVEKIYPNLKYIKSESYLENPEKYYLDAEFTRSGFMKKFTENRSETILSDEFNNRLNELTSDGYIVFTTSEN